MIPSPRIEKYPSAESISTLDKLADMLLDDKLYNDIKETLKARPDISFAAARELALLPDNTPIGEVAGTAASALLRGARGNSGVILSQFFRGIAKSHIGSFVQFVE